ncbi:MAG TPA: MFS transporter [Polyangiales bacterium]|nr:MFS transporter [Polyangiales bacterium]
MAAPEVERLHEVDHAAYTLWVFAVPMLAATLIEAPIALLSDRWPRRRVLVGGLLGLGFALGLCALAHSAWVLAVGLSLAGASSGVACAAAQSELVSTFPGGAQRAMSRWIALAAAGDALTPLAVAAALWVGGTHRTTFGVLAAATVASALLVLRRAPAQGAAGTDEEPELPLMAAVRTAAKRPRLWLLLYAASTCILLDEVVVGMAALRLHELAWSPSAIAAALSAHSCGGVVGALWNERLLGRWSPRRLMACSALGSIGCLGLFIVAPSAPLACAALFLLGICSAPHYPLIQASAYELSPNQPGVVNALASALNFLELLLPLAVGALAERHGLHAALASLAFEPLFVLLVALVLRPR